MTGSQGTSVAGMLQGPGEAEGSGGVLGGWGTAVTCPRQQARAVSQASQPSAHLLMGH